VSFSHRGARSAALTGTFAFLVIAETAAVHLAIFRRAPVLAAALTLASALALVLFFRDYTSMGALFSTLTERELRLRVGLRASADIPRGAIASAISPSWRDRPASRNRAFLDPTAPAEPNVLLRFREPLTIRVLGGRRRGITTLLLWVDRPEELLAALSEVPDAV
jgi:hypothetical protein